MIFKKIFQVHVIRLTGFVMIPLETLYDEYIDRPKFTGLKRKNPFEYVVPPPESWPEHKSCQIYRCFEGRFVKGDIYLDSW